MPNKPFQNQNVFRYVLLAKLRHDIWQVLYASATAAVLFQIKSSFEAEVVATPWRSPSFIFMTSFNFLCLYSHPNSDYVAYSSILWWFNDLNDIPWLLFKLSLISSIGYVIHFVAQINFLNDKRFIDGLIGRLFRLIFFILAVLNLWLGYNGGYWSTFGYKLPKGKLTAADQSDYNSKMSHWTNQSGEQYAFVDLIAALLVTLQMRRCKCVNVSLKVYGNFIFLHIIMNIDKLIQEVWKITNNQFFYQTTRHNNFFNLPILTRILDFQGKAKYLAFMQENIVIITLIFFFLEQGRLACENGECERPARMRCPSCLNLQINAGHFCS